jgi:hypothetical protein
VREMDGRTERHADERMLGRHGTKREGLSERDTRAKNLAWAQMKKNQYFVEFCEPCRADGVWCGGVCRGSRRLRINVRREIVCRVCLCQKKAGNACVQG